MHAHDIMIDDFDMVREDASLQEAAALMQESGTHVLAVGTPERILGILSQRDLAIEGCGKGRDPRSTQVSEVMTPRVASCRVEEDLGAVMRLMREQDVEAVFVRAPSERIVGLLPRIRVLETLASADDKPRGPVPEHVKRVRGETS